MKNDTQTEITKRPGSLMGMLVFSIALAALLAGLTGWAWQKLPPNARIPIHWDGAGKADHFGGPGFLFMFPAAILGISLFLAALPALEPRQRNLTLSSKPYKIVWCGVLILLSAMHVTAVMIALGHPLPMTTVAATGAGLFLAVMGNYLGKIRSNFMFGIRTPWTLSSELSWNKTHRLGGKLMMFLGSVVAIGGLTLTNVRPLTWIILAGLPVLFLLAACYSYFIWRNDPSAQSSH